MVYRNHARDYPFAEWKQREADLGITFWGIAALGGGNTIDLETNDGVTIDLSYFPGSGLTYKNGFIDDTYWGENYGFAISLAAHEFSHYFFGSGHPTRENLGLMGGTYRAMNSVERERLGWIRFSDLTQPNATIPDYVTQNIALRIPINGTYEYFAIENRQQLSIYDDVKNRKGLYITHVFGATQDYIGLMDLECADGNFDWFVSEFLQNPYDPNYPNNDYDIAIWGKIGANQVGGIDERDNLYAYNPHTGSWEYYYKVFDKLPDGTLVLTEEHLGDSEDAFNVGYNNIFSPWSNPPSDKWSHSLFDVGLEIVSFNSVNKSFNLKFYNGNPEDAPPSKPQDLIATPILYRPQSGLYITRLTWDSNSEPDINRYYIYRQLVELPHWVWEEWTCIGSTTDTTFDDNVFEYWLQGNTFRLDYRIRVNDNSGKYSNYSEEVHIYNVSPMFPKKDDKLPSDSLVNSIIVSEFDLKDNYPNPFNPQTTIVFDLSKDIQVLLEIFDINGRKICTLVNKPKEAGTHQVIWNGQDDHGNSVASGVYIYRLQAGEFVPSRKMLFMK